MVSASYQRGVALLQVLLISAVIALLALQLTFSGRDQVAAAAGLESRIKAQLLAHSVLQTAIFTELANDVTALAGSAIDITPYRALSIDGTPRQISENVQLSQQDITALLPQAYPEHPLWPKVLAYLGYDAAQQQRLLGVMQDLQDEDNIAWQNGVEPALTSSGMPYMNKPVQLPTTLKLALADDQAFANELSYLSHHYANFSVNIAMAPLPILAAVIGAEAAQQLVLQRQRGEFNRAALQALLPADLGEEAMTMFPSTKRRFKVDVTLDEVRWSSAVDVNLSSLGRPPYYQIGRQYE